ncbi:Malate synthase, glyoxysomal [Chionoecetes opilio]|uniref:malate synthase n=1 Tax=Chionoecetes opilio TaxID=41210 RepID=A0A8J4XMH9_CHIOP|nr:Malate synthase, glyoxysomal [Chionoecetes opilio]
MFLLQKHKLGNLKWHGVSAVEVLGVEVEEAPQGMEEALAVLLTPAALQFVADLTRQFNSRVDHMLNERVRRKVELDVTGSVPNFLNHPQSQAPEWRVDPAPRRLRDRRLDLGDVSPANTDHFLAALKCDVNGIQTDFDDGHCPTWPAQLRGLHNVYRVVHGLLPGLGDLGGLPVLMLRPRAWNMVEHNLLVDGREVPGPLFDFGLLMFHCAGRLIQAESGPFFYLSKLEGANEAHLWDDIFCWAQDQLNIPRGTIKACVLIENILASFEMEAILYELRHHSVGLNCGIWDYSASFRHRGGFVLPDRNKYVNMQRHFLRSYMDLVVHTCHRRGAHATGGMAASILDPKDTNTLTQVTAGKLREVVAGVDGFMVYDLRLVPVMLKLYGKFGFINQIDRVREDVRVTPADLLQMPAGGVTLEGLKHNVAVGVLFVAAWLRGEGHYIYKAAVEDSATAEISRSQVWQWLRHRATLEGSGEVITRRLVQSLIKEFVDSGITGTAAGEREAAVREQLSVAAQIFEEVVTKREFPEFLTTYLNQDHTFRACQKRLSC